MSFLSPSNRLFELARRGRRLPHPVLAVVTSVACIVASQLTGGLAVLLGLRTLFPGGQASLADAPLQLGLATAATLIGAFAGVFAWLWAWLRWFERRPFWTLGFERAGAWPKYVRGLVVAGLMFAAALGLNAAFGHITSEPGGDWLTAGGALAVYLGWAVQGAGEEVLMRGWLMPVVGARYRPWIGIVVSALVFAALHSLNPGISPLALFNLFLFGLFSALYVLWEGSLWGICAWHAAWNWVQGNVFGLPVSGNDMGALAVFNLHEAGPDLITGGAFGPEGGLAVTAMLIVAIGLLLASQARRHDRL